MADSVFGELTAAWKAATDGWLWLFTSLQSSVLGNLLLLWLGWAVLAAVLGRRRQLLHRAGLLKRLLPASYGGAGTAFPKRWAVVTGGAQGIGRAVRAPPLPRGLGAGGPSAPARRSAQLLRRCGRSR